jgi:hypothetical protein
VPVVSLDRLGIERDQDGFLSSRALEPLRTGAEAAPFLDSASGVVYKLFDLRKNGALGKKLVVSSHGGELSVSHDDAVLSDTLDKLSTLNLRGAHPTEIVGLAASGDYLVAKQAKAGPYKEFYNDLQASLDRIEGVRLACRGLRHTAIAAWAMDRAWILADFHERNIMRDASDRPTVIDALIGAIPPLVLRDVPDLAFAVEQATALAEGRAIPERTAFDDVDNDSL